MMYLTYRMNCHTISSPTRTAAEQSALAASRHKVARHGNPQSTEHGKPQAVYARGWMSRTCSGKARDGREGEEYRQAARVGGRDKARGRPLCAGGGD